MQQGQSIRNNLEQEIGAIKFGETTETVILDHWRQHQSKRIEKPRVQGGMRQLSARIPDPLANMQIAFQRSGKTHLKNKEDKAEDIKEWKMKAQAYLRNL